MMSLRAVCILLAFCATRAVEEFDVHDAQMFLFEKYEPNVGNSREHIEVYAILDTKGVLDHLTEIVMFWSEPGDEEEPQMLALVNSTGSYKFMEESKFDANAELDSPSDSVGVLSIDWRHKGDGYCHLYTARFTGVDSEGVTRRATESFNVGPHGDSTCVIKPKVQIPEYIQTAFPGTTRKQQVDILDKIQSIDENVYDVSGIYQGRVYIATMQDTHFELHKMNELCKSSGGYLVELDSLEEQNFVRDFLKSLGSYRYFTGANDVDSEGNFVYYNSKKPMTNVVWSKGEPNNAGNEDCVEIKYTGLNDRRCSREWGYICEIPLL